MAKKTNAFGKLLCLSAILALIGMVVYVVNTTTGYMAGLHTPIDPLVLILPFIVIVCALFLTLRPDACKGATGAVTLILSLLMAAATVFFVKGRVDVVGDMLNPVNHPDTQVTAVTWSLIGIGLYCLSYLFTVVTTLSDKLAKE